MKNKRKIIVFIIIILISISSLVFKGYFSDETYVLNESDNLSSNEENIKNEEQIKKYLAEAFKIPVEKIKLYSMGG